MSIIIPVTTTITANPSGFDTTNSFYESATNIDSGYSDVSSRTYAQFYLKTGSEVHTWIYYTFDLSSIPNNATITSVACSVRDRLYNVTDSTVAVHEDRMYTGTKAKGTATNITSTSAATRTLSPGTDWTVAEVKNARVVFHAQRATSNIDTSVQYRFYGATLTIDYTVDEIGYEVKVESSIPNTKGVYAEPEYQAILASDTSTLQDIVIRNKDQLNLNLIDNGTKVTSFSANSYTYSIASLTIDHIIKLDEATSNFTKIDNQWHSINAIYQKNSNVWTSTTFTSAFPSGTVIKQGNDILDSKPLVKFLASCNVRYITGTASSDTLYYTPQTYTVENEDDGKNYYVLTIANGSLGLHKVVFDFQNRTQVITNLIEYGSYSKIYINWTTSSVALYVSSTGSSYSNHYNKTIITLELRSDFTTKASELESLFTNNSGIIDSTGWDQASSPYLVAVDDYWPCYCLITTGTRLGLSKIDTAKNIYSILGCREDNLSLGNRSFLTKETQSALRMGKIGYCSSATQSTGSISSSAGGGTIIYM